jgi:hypothetical protein
VGSNFERWLLSDEPDPRVGFLAFVVVALPWWVGFWTLCRWLLGLGR